MSIRNGVQEVDYSNAKGLDVTSLPSMIQPGFVQEARNADLTLTGGYKKRKGFAAQSNVWSTNKIIGGFEYVDTSGSLQQLFVSPTELARLDTGVFTGIKSGLSGTKPSLVQFDQRLFFFNGIDTPFIYEGGSTTRSLGLAAPSTKPSVALGPGSGNLTDGATYLWVYTYAIESAGKIVAESSPSPVSDSLTMDSSGDATVTVTLPTDTNVNQIRIYRTVGAGSIFFLETTLSASTSSFTSTASDETLSGTGVQLEDDNSRLSDFVNFTLPRFPIIARNRLFIVSNDQTTIRFSKIGQNGAMPESFEATKFVEARSKKGLNDKIVGLGSVKNVPVVLKERSIGILEEVGLPDITDAVDNTTYIYRELTDSVGAISHHAQVQVFDELVFLGRDNIYAVNGQTVRPVASTLQSLIQKMDKRASRISEYSAINDVENKRIYFAVFKDVFADAPSLIIVGDYQQYPNFRWTTYEPGDNASTHPGLRPASFFSFTSTVDGKKEVYFGNFDGNGKYYKMNTGDDDDGKAIFFKLKTRPYAADSPARTKLFKDVRIFAEAANSDYDLEFCSVYNLSTAEEFCQLFKVPGAGDKWDAKNWDELIWAGEVLAELVYDPHRKGKFIQLVFKQTGLDEPATLLGWSLVASAEGLKA